jgi:hypothetical protein
MRRGAVGLLIAALLASCGVHGLSLVQDLRVKIVAPRDRSKVTLPVTVQWVDNGYQVGAGQGSFGVLVDQPTPPPGQTLAWRFRNDCKGCVDAAFMAQRRVFSTTRTAFRVDQIGVSPSSQDGSFHQVTIVLLDAQGRRVGEGAWSFEFTVPGHK